MSATSPDSHAARIKTISERVKYFYSRNEKFRIYHGSTSTTRATVLSRANTVDTSQMKHVIGVDKANKTITVEPKVSMVELVNATLEHGLLPPVVMEFPAITVGGGFAGTSGESSSFKYGFFDNTVDRIEIVLADGEVVWASKDERADLFNAAAGTFGTFGVITSLRIPLIDASRYVRVTFQPTYTLQGSISGLEESIQDTTNDYVEGIMFSKQEGIIITGRLTDKQDPELPVTCYTRPHDTWFYLRAQEVLKKARKSKSSTAVSEIVPIKDYLFRYDRGAFWAGMYGFRYMVAPFTHFMRYLLDPLMHTATMYHAMHKSHMADQYVVQDIGFPHSKLGAFIDYTDETMGFYPLWLCPLKMQGDLSLRPRDQSTYMQDSRYPKSMINVGLWGPGAKDYDKFVKLNREIEHKTAELGGLKCFYAQAFYTEEEFWKIYDKEWYDELRAKYKASSLPTVYEKVNAAYLKWKPKSEQTFQERMKGRMQRLRPFNGIYGTFHAMLKKDYLLKQ
ncbi:hypothetical protein AMS68_007232 [Peltaster fructicola]|uniref:Delta(24)-sterol reductase n=1 Tax=Peltaster fructicola TaxID=286661 RepID=A0A6H0Y462_9PEZI|nr:hypothetical protein AMS68_007232 [Peltaster fructicola]